jgi:REP element-mobilizing transposase RayT
MGRQWRIEFAGAFYHILSRGNEGGDIFYDDEDRRLFLDTLAEMSERFDLNIYAYVLMDNHYHLLLRTNLPNLSKVMQWFGLTYTRRFNNRHFRSGHLFQGRYKSIIVQNDAYLVRLSCYIHRNPIRAGIVERLADYKWSSYQYYAYRKKPPDWLATDMILSQFKNADNRNRAYRKKAQEYSDEENRIWEDLRNGIVLGTKNYVSKIRAAYLPDSLNAEIPQQKIMAKGFDSEKLLNLAAKHLGCDLKRFKEAPRISSKEKEDRDILIYLLWKTGRLTNAKIGNLFGVTYSSVSHSIRAVNTGMKKDKELKRKIYELYSLFKI